MWLHQNGRRQVPFWKKTRKRATGCIIGAYARYIRQVVVDKKMCKIVTNM